MADGYRGDETTGFASPAPDYIEDAPDLGRLLNLRDPNRYPLRVVGQALLARGIQDGDILVVDTAADPVSGQVCLAMIDDSRLLAELRRREGDWVLLFSSGRVVPVAGDVAVWGVVCSLVRAKV